MSLEAPPPTIRHDPAAHTFYAEVEGLRCHADYRMVGRTMVMHHTFVPRELEGRGLAGRLVQHAVDHARRHALRIDPQCHYVAGWIRRHPEAADLLA